MTKPENDRVIDTEEHRKRDARWFLDRDKDKREEKIIEFREAFASDPYIAFTAADAAMRAAAKQVVFKKLIALLETLGPDAATQEAIRLALDASTGKPGSDPAAFAMELYTTAAWAEFGRRKNQ